MLIDFIITIDIIIILFYVTLARDYMEMGSKNDDTIKCDDSWLIKRYTFEYQDISFTYIRVKK